MYACTVLSICTYICIEFGTPLYARCVRYSKPSLTQRPDSSPNDSRSLRFYTSLSPVTSPYLLTYVVEPIESKEHIRANRALRLNRHHYNDRALLVRSHFSGDSGSPYGVGPAFRSPPPPSLPPLLATIAPARLARS